MSLTELQHTVRATGLGGSDVAAVLGMDPYRTAHDVWMEKTGKAEPFRGNEFTAWGERLEPVIAEWYAERNQVWVAPSDTIVHPRMPWVVGTPDRLVFAVGCPDKPTHGLEIKNKGFRQRPLWGADGGNEDAIPEAVALQCCWYQCLTELDRWDVAALIGGNEPRTYSMRRDLALESNVLDVASRFWFGRVVADSPPPVDGGEGAERMLRSLFPRPLSAEVVPGPPEALEWATKRAELRAAAAALETEAATYDQLLKMTIGEREGIEFPGGRATWRMTAGTGTAWEAVARAAGADQALIDQHKRPGYRRLYISTPKEKKP